MFTQWSVHTFTITRILLMKTCNWFPTVMHVSVSCLSPPGLSCFTQNLNIFCHILSPLSNWLCSLDKPVSHDEIPNLFSNSLLLPCCLCRSCPHGRKGPLCLTGMSSLPRVHPCIHFTLPHRHSTTLFVNVSASHMNTLVLSHHRVSANRSHFWSQLNKMV